MMTQAYDSSLRRAELAERLLSLRQAAALATPDSPATTARAARTVGALTREGVLAWLGPELAEKGERYVQDGRVSKVRHDPPMLTALVRDAAARPYGVCVRFADDGSIDATCTCPLGHGCKHIAAALLAATENVAPTPAPVFAETKVSPGVLSWLTDLQNLTQAIEHKRHDSKSARTMLFYSLAAQDGEARVHILKGSRPETARAWTLTERALVTPPQFVDEDDLSVLRRLWHILRRSEAPVKDGILLYGEDGGELLEKLVATQRLMIAGQPGMFLEDGGTRSAQVVWKLREDGLQRSELEVQPEAEALPVSPPWYLDRSVGELGPLNLRLSLPMTEQLLALPPLRRDEAAEVAEVLAELAPEAPRPASDPGSECRVLAGPPRGLLHLDTLDVVDRPAWRGYAAETGAGVLDYATVTLCYGDARLSPEDPREFFTLHGGEIVRLQRDHAVEAALIAGLLQTTGLAVLPEAVVPSTEATDARRYGLASEADWPIFMREGVPALQAAGWQVEFDVRFRHHYLEVDVWQAEVREADPGWLSLDMGVMVGGERLSLAPLLSNLFRRDPRWLDALTLSAIPPDALITLETEDGRRLRVPAERLKPLARVLIDLFDGYADGPLRLSRWDAARLSELQDKRRWQFRGSDAVLRLAERLQASQGVQEVTPPRDFQLNLRDYQRQGLAWLQYLREQDLAGILADDMGLGKTAQALAHLLKEKEQGFLTQPALVVLPTSLIFNWKSEAERFAPTLKVLSLHGKERKEKFAEIPDCDVALTTYPLLWRDGEALKQYEYHLLILDEAQTVKNFRSKGATVVRQLRARHRLCLTGTPLENHLGELWAQFDFLLPGFLGDSKSFVRTWKQPIEKLGDTLRRDLLARRLRPFILRRRKDEVATELPPKTIIVRTVELDGAQRDLYETVRAAMDEKVRDEIANRGFRRSQIIILDALLKLRQVCCDPRLVKSVTADKVKERAKLELLMDMLPELAAEGRKILVFSQFTAMLDLIQTELEAIRLPFVRLDGETRDRETPIRQFQDGQAPVFLISLKAGGVGLNLTAADTVIHYDPWWNPAVESQATDRAHRLGQDKPVFVYKLIVAGSIEEKILSLQEKKAELAAGILSESHQGDVKFSEADIAALFEPLPGGAHGSRRSGRRAGIG